VKVIKNMPLKMKLYSYAGVMLSLLSFSFIYAIYSLVNIGHELDTIVDEDIPLTTEVSRITVTQLEQAIAFEQALHYGSIIAHTKQAHPNEQPIKYQDDLEHYKRATSLFDAATVKITTIMHYAQSMATHSNTTNNPLQRQN
jgi:methyl-accepting chemotaxis protein